MKINPKEMQKVDEADVSFCFCEVSNRVIVVLSLPVDLYEEIFVVSDDNQDENAKRWRQLIKG